MGAVSGTTVARFLKVSRRERDHLIACGAGAGLAGAFNAPLAGFLFVIEEFNRNLAPMTYGTVLISSLMATLVTQASLGQIPSFHIPQYPTPPLEALPLFVVLGVCAGFLASRSTARCCIAVARAAVGWARKRGRRAAWWDWWWRWRCSLSPRITGGGHSVAEILLKGTCPAAIPCGSSSPFWSASCCSPACALPQALPAASLRPCC
jgi:CIC family chloride channel protein